VESQQLNRHELSTVAKHAKEISSRLHGLWPAMHVKLCSAAASTQASGDVEASLCVVAPSPQLLQALSSGAPPTLKQHTQNTACQRQMPPQVALSAREPSELPAKTAAT
jgi:hypothetical protein